MWRHRSLGLSMAHRCLLSSSIILHTSLQTVAPSRSIDENKTFLQKDINPPLFHLFMVFSFIGPVNENNCKINRSIKQSRKHRSRKHHRENCFQLDERILAHKNERFTVHRVMITRNANFSLLFEQPIWRCPFVWIEVISWIRILPQRPHDSCSTVPRMMWAFHVYSISSIKRFLSLSIVRHFNVSTMPRTSPGLPITITAVVNWRSTPLFLPPRPSIPIRNVNWRSSCSSKTNEVDRHSNSANACSRNWLIHAKTWRTSTWSTPSLNRPTSMVFTFIRPWALSSEKFSTIIFHNELHWHPTPSSWSTE